MEYYEVNVDNLDKNVTSKDLHRIFSSCGDVVNAKIILDHDRKSLSLGIVEFSSNKSACLAIDVFDGSMIKEQKVRVYLAKRKLDLPNSSWRPSLRCSFMVDTFDPKKN